MTLLEHLQSRFPDSSRTTLRQLLQNGRVSVNGEVEKDAKLTIDEGDIVDVGPKPTHRALPPGVTVLHEDDAVIVLLKPHGLLTVATERERENTLQAGLNRYLAGGGKERIHVVHRLDRETSGVLVFAKTFPAREALKEQFAAHSADRMYIAVIEGSIAPAEGTIRSYLLEGGDLKMRSTKKGDGKLAVTHYRTIETKGAYAMLEVTLETGRKNQIRAHLSEAGHPVAGDQFYGAATNPLGRLGLHAKLLGFTHPATGERLSFTAPIPHGFRELFR
jgi:RluA family pseudouridine synthase